MADGDNNQQQQYDTSQLDQVQHPTLGTLKFPHEMPPDERNQIIEGLEKNPPNGSPAQKSASLARNAQPTQFEQQNTPGFFGKAMEVARRFTQGAGLPQSTEAGDYNPLRGGTEMVTHPIESAKLLGTAALDAMKARRQKGAAAAESASVDPSWLSKANKYLNAGTYYAEGMVPFVGPMVGTMADEGEQALREKDPWAGAGTAAEALGAGVTAGLTKGGTKPVEVGGPDMVTNALAKARGTEIEPAAATTVRPEGAFQPALANTPAEVLQHAAKNGIDLTPAQASGSRVSAFLQKAGEHGIVGGKPLEEALNTNRAKFGQVVNDLSERVDPTRLGLSEESAGEAIQHSAQVAKQVAADNARDAYKNLPLQGQTVNTTRIAAGWRQLRGGMPTGVEDQILAQVPRNMKATVSEILSPTGLKAPLDFQQTMSLRSLFRELGETVGADLPDRQQGVFRQMSNVVDNAMEQSAKKGGFDKEWRSANQGWKDYVGKYGDKQSPLYKIISQKDPAKITRDLVNRAAASDIETLTKEGMTEAIEPLRRQVLQDIARNKFTVGRDGLGGYSDSFLNQLFGAAGKKELYLNADLAKRLNWEPNPSGTGGVNLMSEQLGKPTKAAQLFGAAKASMPRPAASYFTQPSGPRYNISPGLAAAALLRARNMQANEQ
jgi:hypothetical protein